MNTYWKSEVSGMKQYSFDYWSVQHLSFIGMISPWLFMKLLINIVFWQNLDPEYESVLNTSLQWILNSGEDVGIK